MNSGAGRWLTRQSHGFDWSLIKGSALLSVGMGIARIMGLAFSLVLASVFPAGEYGGIRYAIAVASIVAIGTMPFGQHVIARFVGKYQRDEAKLDAVLSNGLSIISVVFAFTLLVAVPILLFMGRFQIGVLAIVFGETLFYTYWGLSSGFLDSRRLTAAYLGSNLVQILLVILLIEMLGIRSATVALLVYGLSYILPLACLVVFWPLPGHFRFRLVGRKMIGELLRFSLPIWISHACYTLSLSLDLLFLGQMGSVTQLGAYSLSKTFATVFLIVPSGISTLLMPKIAASSQEGHRPLLVRMLFMSASISALALTAYLPLAQPVTLRVFGADYLVPLSVSLLLSFYMIAYAIHGLITAYFVGRSQPQLESASRVVELVFITFGCWLLVPGFGALGAAIAMFSGKAMALLTYGAIGILGFFNIGDQLTNPLSREVK